MKLEQMVERLYQIRQAKKALEREEKQLVKRLGGVVDAAGGVVDVGKYRLVTHQISRPQISAILREIERRYPELAEDISELQEKHRTCYRRLDIIPLD